MTQSISQASPKNGALEQTLTRRTVLLSLSAGALSALAPGLAQGEDNTGKQTTQTPHQALAETALDCVGWGERCQKHIMTLFLAGDTSLAQCSARIHDMVAVCNALASLAAAESDHLKPFAKVCIDVCKSCEQECRKHEQHHPICKDTAEACARVVAACQKVIA